MAAGIPHELFWELSAPEVEEVLKRRVEEERRENRLFGLVAAAVLNVHRKPGSRPIQPEDFFREKIVPEYMTVEEAQTMLDQWAAGCNVTQESA